MWFDLLNVTYFLLSVCPLWIHRLEQEQKNEGLDGWEEDILDVFECARERTSEKEKQCRSVFM